MEVRSAQNSRGFTLILEMSDTTSIANNTSTIPWALKLSAKQGASGAFDSYGIGWSVKIGGIECGYHDRYTSDRFTCLSGQTITLQSGTVVQSSKPFAPVITHNADGTKTINCEASIDMASSPYGAGAMSLSGDWTLATIPRASSMTWTPELITGASTTFEITRASDTFTHTITIAFQGQSVTIGTGIETSQAWTVPSSWVSLMPNTESANATLTLTTYSGSTQIGVATYTAPVTVSADIVPAITSVTVTPYNANTWLNSKQYYVGGYTQADVVTVATAGAGATIASIVATGGITGSGESFRSAVLTAGTKIMAVTVTDSRGRTATITKSITVQPYSMPTITSATAERGTYANGTWTADDNGNHIKIVVTGKSTLSGNKCNLYLDINGSTYTQAGSTSSNTTTKTWYITDTDNEHVYEAEIYATDDVGNTGATTVVTISTSDVSFSWQYDRIGIGKVAQKPKYLEVAYDMELGKIENVEQFLMNSAIFHGTCDSAGSATAKVATVTGAFPDTLTPGTAVMITFANANSGAVASLTLNVNGTGAFPIKYVNNSALGNLSAVGQIRADVPVMFVYTESGTNKYWVVTGLNYNTTYSSMSEAEAIAGTATSSRVITAKILDTAIKSKFPYIEEEGTDGDWTYRKWSSGIAECWCKKQWNVGTFSLWSNGVYQSSARPYWTFPSDLFLTAPVLEATHIGDSGAWFQAVVSDSGTATLTNEHTNAFVALRPNDYGGWTLTSQLYARGTWK